MCPATSGSQTLAASCITDLRDAAGRGYAGGGVHGILRAMNHREAGPAPDQARLHEAALTHLARFAATQAGLVRVLDRRVDRWARAAAAEDDAVRVAKAAVRVVVAKLVAQGLVDDAAFAASRASSLTRGGKSRRAVAAHLMARGVTGDALRDAVPGDPETELAAALVFVRRRRIGPFRVGVVDEDGKRRELGMLARAGFAQDVASRALAMEMPDAEALVIGLRRA
jgi:regulatory protein